jgi:hypothetical protein
MHGRRLELVLTGICMAMHPGSKGDPGFYGGSVGMVCSFKVVENHHYFLVGILKTL